jgi:hypothetical protein
VLGAVGMLQVILRVMLQGAGPVDYYSKVLKGCFVFGRFIPGSSFLDPPFRALFLVLRVQGVLGAQDSLGSRWPLHGLLLPRLLY